MSANRILVADDSPWIVDAVEAFLQGRGCVVDRARDGSEALRAASQRRYDGAVLDLIMPGASGMEVALRLRARDPGLPVALVSGEPMLAESTAVAAPVVGLTFLTKPFVWNDLWQALRTTPPPPACPQLLLVERDHAQARRWEAALGGTFEIATAADGATAEALASRMPFDLALAPADLVPSLRRAAPDLYVVLQTATEGSSAVRDMLQSGADAFLSLRLPQAAALRRLESFLPVARDRRFRRTNSEGVSRGAPPPESPGAGSLAIPGEIAGSLRSPAKLPESQRSNMNGLRR